MATDTTLPAIEAIAPTRTGGALAIRWVFPATDGRLARLSAGVNVIGRDENAAITLEGGSVSRRHAEISWQPGAAAMLTDLDSRNGVFVRGQRIARAPLKLGDVLRFGDWVGVLTQVASSDSEGGGDNGTRDWQLEELIEGYWAGPVLRATLAPARLIATTGLSVLIQGETGSGKEGAARAIHLWSGRRGPFLALNCAALPDTLVESELFGYRKGAFSGADRPNTGFLRAAHEGTLLLDEIADLSVPTQAKLLRAIQEKEVVPLGESKPHPIDVRLIGATHVNLREAVAQGRFRADLYARLRGFVVETPPLRERAEEIPLLFTKLLSRYAPIGRLPAVDAAVVETLCAYRWPFNLRDLTSLVVRLAALYPGAALVDKTMILDLLGSDDADGRDAGIEEPPAEPQGRSAPPAGDATPAELLASLRRNRGNIRRSAEDLGITRSRLYRLIEKMDALDLPALRREPG